MLPTWSGSRVPLWQWRKVLAGWIRHLSERLADALDPPVPLLAVEPCPCDECRAQRADELERAAFWARVWRDAYRALDGRPRDAVTFAVHRHEKAARARLTYAPRE